MNSSWVEIIYLIKIYKVNSLFSVFDLASFITNPSLEVQKIIVFFMVLQAFIFTVKNILFSYCEDSEIFEARQKSADKEVKRLRELRRWKEA